MMYEHDYKTYPELRSSELSTLQYTSPHKQILEDFEAQVIKVIDGDTIRLRTTFRDFDFPLRITDLDAPEMNAPGGKAAREWLKTRIEGKEIKVLIDKYNRVDKYGRLLGRVISMGQDVAQEEIYLGLAVPYSRRNEGKFPELWKMFNIKKWV